MDRVVLVPDKAAVAAASAAASAATAAAAVNAALTAAGAAAAAAQGETGQKLSYNERRLQMVTDTSKLTCQRRVSSTMCQSSRCRCRVHRPGVCTSVAVVRR